MRLAQRIESNVRILEGALMNVCAYASLNKVELTPALVDEIIRDYATGSTASRVTIEEIGSHVAAHFDLTLEDLQSARRSAAINRARQIAIFLSRELTDHSLNSIGQFFGGRDHSTVIHAFRKVSDAIEREPQTLWLINNMKATLSE